MEIEKAMLTAMRAIREEAVVAGRLAATAEADGLGEMAHDFREQGRAASDLADTVLTVLQQPL